MVYTDVYMYTYMCVGVCVLFIENTYIPPKNTAITG